MTSVDYSDRSGVACIMEEVYKIPKKEISPFKTIFQKEREIVKHIEANGGIVNSISSCAISTRRFKRRRAKLLKQLIKKQVIVL